MRAAPVGSEAQVLSKAAELELSAPSTRVSFPGAGAAEPGLDDSFERRLVRSAPAAPSEDEHLALQIAAHSYPGAETELATLLDDLRHGRSVKI
jgi:hypothetical protein